MTMIGLKHIDGNTGMTPREFVSYAGEEIKTPGHYLIYRNFRGSQKLPATIVDDEVTNHFIKTRVLKNTPDEYTHIIKLDQQNSPANRIGTLFKFFPVYLEEVEYKSPVEFATTREVSEMADDRPLIDRKLNSKLNAITHGRKETYLLNSGGRTYILQDRPWNALGEVLEELRGAHWAVIEAYDRLD